MFFNTHAFVSSKTFQPTDLIIIGSILPDLALTKIISWKEGLHDERVAKKFKKFTSNEFDSYSDLSKGISTHIAVDEVSHSSYKGSLGFAFQNNRELTSLVKEYYDVDESQAREKAHNYIESAVEIYLLKNNPGIQKLVEQSINNVNKKELSKIISSFFKLQRPKVDEAIKVYLSLIVRYDLSTEHDWIFLWQEIERMIDLKSITSKQKEELIKVSLRTVGANWTEFLDYSINRSIKASL